MKYLTTAAVAVLLVGTMGGISLAQSTDAGNAPPASPPAQTGDTNAHPHPGMTGHWARQGGWNRMGQMHGGMRGNILSIACGDRGAEALEIAFVHMKYAVKPDATQAPLLDALRSAALTDQKNFAQACQTAMQPEGNAGQRTILERLQMQQTLVNAHAAALNDVLPKFKAFYDSLNDGQKATLDHSFGRRGQFGWPGIQGWNGMHGWNRSHQNGGNMHGTGDHMQPPAGGQNSDDTTPPATDQQDDTQS